MFVYRHVQKHSSRMKKNENAYPNVLKLVFIDKIPQEDAFQVAFMNWMSTQMTLQDIV